MSGIGVSAVTANTAHREWASRPPDERYASVHELYQAARARRERTEERDIVTADFRTEAVDDDLVLHQASGRTASLTHWSFGQLAIIAGAPAQYLRTLPAAIASNAVNVGLQRQRRERHQLLVERAAPWRVHAITSQRYARVHHDELASRVLDLQAEHSAWHLPLAYKDGEYGAERVPSGAYLGDRDMFLFVVDGNRDLDDPTDRTDAGLFRGFILRNSDVGAAALTLDLFLFRAVCANHLILGFQHVAGFRRRHVGASIQDAWTASLDAVRAALDADTAADRAVLQRAMTQELGPTRDAVLAAVVQRLDVSQKQAAEAYTLADTYEPNPRSRWGYAQGLTRLSQRTAWQDGRFALDRAASRLITSVH
jgi:plasmid stability protein